MALDNEAVQPMQPNQPAAPVPAAGPAPDVSTQPADLSTGLSALAVPTNQPGVTGTTEYGQYADAVAAQQAATKRAAELASTPVISPDAPHARLLQMVTSLATGLSALGTSIATKGAEGGAKEVAQIQGEQQRQKLEAQQAAMAQRNQQVQQQLTVANTNQALAQSYLNLLSVPDEIEQRHLAVQQGQQALESGRLGNIGQTQDIRTKALQDLITTGDMDAYNSTLQQVGVTGAAGTTPGAPAGQPAVPPAALANWQNSVAAAGAYSDDPVIKQQAAILSDPKADPKALASAANIIRTRVGALDAGAASREKQANAATAVTKSQQEQASQSAYLANVPKDAAGKPTQDFATWQAVQTDRAKQAVEEGDPILLGDQLAQNLVAPSEVISSRSMSKPFYEKVLAEANKRSLELYGKPYNMAGAEQQYAFVKQFNDPNSKMQVGITSGNTFLNHAADLKTLASELQTTNVPLFNAPLNKLKGKFGDADIARLNAAVQPVITEYQNALAAGFAPQAEDAEAARAILNPASSVSQINAAAEQMAHTLLRRMSSVDQMYYTHTGVHYPNMITPDAKQSLGKLGLDSGELQSGGTFGSGPQPVNAGSSAPTSSGKAVSLKSAMALPINKGKTADQVRADIIAHGHQVKP